LIVSNTSGAQLETYVIAGPRGSGVITMNGAAAHLIKTGKDNNRPIKNNVLRPQIFGHHQEIRLHKPFPAVGF
jgi:hypothetical protein